MERRIPLDLSPVENVAMDTLTAIAVFILTLILYGVIEICKTLRTWHKQDKKTEGLPAVPGRHWLWGTETDSITNCALMVSDQSKRCKAFKVWYGPKVVIHLVHPETVKTFLARPYKGETVLHKILRPWAGNGLFLSEGDYWRRNRKVLTPAFHFKVLQSYIEHFNAAMDIFIEEIEKNPYDESKEICHPIHMLVLDILMRCIFSRHDDVQKRGGSHPYVEAISSLQKLVTKRIITFLYHFDLIYYLTASGKRFRRAIATIHGVSEEIIKRRKITLEKAQDAPGHHKLDFLGILLTVKDEEGIGLTHVEIKDEIDTFLFGGLDTTATAIPWILYCLAKHSRHQRLCQQEVDKLFVERETEAIQWEDLRRIPYLTRCIKEAMRLYPSVHMSMRVLNEPLQVEGVTLPAGITVYCNILAVHRNVNVWGEDCEEFRPDRFLQENMAGIDSHAFLPFLAGPRNCIGQNFAMNEMKTVVSRILRCFWLEVDDTHDVQFEQRMTLTAVNGIKLRFVRRS